MANVWAISSGNWSNTAIWSTGALPTAADDVWANTFTVTIDTSPTVLSVRNGTTTNVTTGGTFVPTSGITLTCTGAGVVSGNNAALAVITSSLTSGQSCTVTANLFGGVASNAVGLSNTSTGTVNIIGNVSATTQNSSGHGARNTSSGTINITGNCTGGGSNSGNTFGVRNESSGTVNITGNCFGGANNGVTAGVTNDSLGVVNITGTVNGGSTNQNNFGAINLGAGILTHVGNVQSTSTSPGIGGGSLSQVTILSGPFLTVATGINPVVALRWFWANSNVTPTYYQIRTANFATIRPLYTADSVGGNPATSNVRSGTVYGPAGELTGTCAVPGASSVLAGVPVDATTGTATISAADIRAAVGLASANLDAQLSTINTNVSTLPSAATIASTIWQTLTSALNTAGSIGKLLVDNVNATISSRLEASSYIAPLDAAGTRGALGLTSANLDTQLSPLPNLDTTVSSRLAAASYQSPLDAAGTRSAIGLASANLDNQLDALPTASENATAVRTELSPELGRIDVATSTRSTFDPSTDIVAQVTLVDTTTNLTNPVDVPTLEQIASAVRSELEPELDRIDVNVSSRLSSESYTSPPSSAQNAEAVRTELSPELKRLSNCATVQTTGEQIQDALAP